MAGNGCNWLDILQLAMTENGRTWLEMSGNGLKWLKWLEMAGIWVEIAGND